MKKEGISKYKLERIAVESLRNSLRLHFDSILLYKNESYPSCFHLSVLCMEEFSKAKWVNDYVWISETNEGYPSEKDEQEWLKLLYLHPSKQINFIGRDLFDYSPKFSKFIFDRKLELKKQNSIYVGLSRKKGKVDISSRVSTPQCIKQKDAKQLVSLVNSEYLEICHRLEEDDWYFDGISSMDKVFDYEVFRKLLAWPHKTKLKSKNWWKAHRSYGGN